MYVSSSKAPRANQGFTLIELLVVLSIISILAAIIMPVFAKVREKARQSACVSNLKQFATAMTLYADDNNEIYPWTDHYAGPPSPTYGNYWQALIYPYVKSADVYICPSSQQSAVGYNPLLDPPVYDRASYSINVLSFPDDSGTAMSAIREPSQLIMLGDSDAGQIGPPHYLFRFYMYSTNRHNGGCNLAFADTHVKWSRLDKYFTNVGPPGEARVYPYWFLWANGQ